MNFRGTIFFTLFLLAALGYGQDSLKNRVQYNKSTTIDGNIKYTSQKQDSLEINHLTDDDFASGLDQKWLEELYGNHLFDTIYQTINKLDYKEVDFPELPTDTLKKRLALLNAKTPFNIAYNPALENVIKTFLKNRRTSFERLMGLSHFYFPMFEYEFDKYNIPLELKYLAIVESALKPRARSRVGATGLWQFMFSTGKMFGLNVSSYVDERCDPIKSTEAAAKYLSKLYEIFGDWDLALAAYNSGPGNVTKAIRRSGGYNNYWNIRAYLPRETAGYVPAFLATMYIFEYAEEHGFFPEKPVFNHIETDTLLVKQMITLDQVSEKTGVDMETLQFLNPSYKLDIIPFIEEEKYVLRLPRKAAGVFAANEDAIYAFAKAEFDKREKPLPQFFDSDTKITYRVKSGDYLGKIARQYGVRVSQIKQWNGLRSNDLRIGQRLSIYPRTPQAIANVNNTNSHSPSTKTTYVVKEGDSLWSISKKFPGVSVQNIKDWNGISGNVLKPGMKLKISKG
ncbi:MAG TPA: LysM peptidoglycan-binding domain-containing protein [Flavobacteriaceae bacterium]|nr:LysM peptidoglycan-binding domain-containing protein [Flavobacteriaceae bacterium]